MEGDVSSYISGLMEMINEVLENAEDKSTVDDIDLDTSLTEDIGMESLDLAEFAVRIEDEYEVDVFEDEVVDTPREIIEALRSER